jgi:hypothetical protein
MNRDSVLSSVVLPEPDPPETITFSRAFTQPLRELQHARRERLIPHQSRQASAASCRTAGSTSPARSATIGGITAQTREPSLQTRIHNRRRIVNAAANIRHDAIDHQTQMLTIA